MNKTEQIEETDERQMTLVPYDTRMLYATLEKALGMRRPHNTPSTLDFTWWLLGMLPEGSDCHIDARVNLHVDNRKDDTNRTLFVAHVDTVHRTEGKNDIIKTATHWRAGTKDQCLGADDGAGVAILMHLLHANVPGYYIFTQGEEVGGVGAKFLASTNQELLTQFDRAITFDRKDTDNVITHQFTGRCCSDVFAQALADALNARSPDMLMFSPDSTGVYTDTAEFTDAIPECTNLSVGYTNNHGDRETLDMVFYAELAQAAVMLDWDALPTVRNPAAPDPDDKLSGYDYPGLGMTSKYRWDGSWKDSYEKDEREWKKWDNWESKSRIEVGSGEDAAWEDEETKNEDWEDAMCDATVGSYTLLMDMIAETVLPDDPGSAKKHLNTRLITENLLDQAEEFAEGYGVDEALAFLFDNIYKE